MSETGPAQRATRRWGIAIVVTIFVVDQLVKYIVAGPLSLQTRKAIEILPIFRLVWAENRGISLGMLQADSDAMRWVLVAVTAAVAAAVAVWMWREKVRGDALALGMILGGALGNIVDRVRLGYVIDYADLHFGDFSPFLVFNIADAAITIGVLLLVARALLVRDRPAVKAPHYTTESE